MGQDCAKSALYAESKTNMGPTEPKDQSFPFGGKIFTIFWGRALLRHPFFAGAWNTPTPQFDPRSAKRMERSISIDIFCI